MRKFLITAVVMFAILAAAAVAYIGFVYKSESAQMAEAARAVKAGDDDRAREILRKVVSADDANEDAYVQLAGIAERAKEYETAAMRLEQAAALNPLSDGHIERMYKDLFLAQSDNLITRKYLEMERGKKLSAYIRFNAGLAFLRIGSADKAGDILKTLQAEKSPYARVLEANISLSRANYMVAARNFEEVLKVSPNLRDYALLGLAVCALSERNSDEAKKYLSQIGAATPEISATVLILKGRIAIADKDFKSALKHFSAAYALQRSNAPILLDAAEIALSLSDAAAIKKLRETVNTSNKTALMLDYYLSALENAARGNFLQASEDLSLSGTFQSRNAAKILALKLACELNKPEEALEKYELLPADLPEALKNAVAADLGRLMLKNSSNTSVMESLAFDISELRPDDRFALNVMLGVYARQRNFAKVWEAANKLLKADPKDGRAYQARVVALMELNRYSEAFDAVKNLAESAIEKCSKSEKSVKTDSLEGFALASAVRCSAVLDRPEAVAHYAVCAAKAHLLPPQTVLGAGRYLVEKGSPKDVRLLIETLRALGDKPSLCLADIIASEEALKSGRRADAKKFLKSASEELPNFELPYVSLALLDYGDGDKSAAEADLRAGLKNIPDSSTLNLRLASLLAESKDAAKLSEARSILEKLIRTSNPAPYYYSTLAQVLLFQNSPEAALQSARKAASMAPQNAEVLYRLAVCLMGVKSYEDALDVLLKAARNSTDSRLPAAVDECLSQAVASALSASSKKVLAESVLKFFPNSAVAARILKEAKTEIEKKL